MRRPPTLVPAFRLLALPPMLAALLSGCATTVNDLLEEIQYGDPESVREAVIELGDHLGGKEAAGIPLTEADREAIRYLEDIASKSPEPVLRACAIGSLARLRRPEATDIYVAAMEDSSTSWLVRMEAARALAARPDPRAAGPLAARIAEEPRLEVRLEILKALTTVGGETALRTILDVFLDESRRYLNMRLPAYEALCLLSGRLHPFEDVYAWEEYRKERFPTSGPSPDSTPKPFPEPTSDAAPPPATDGSRGTRP